MCIALQTAYGIHLWIVKSFLRDLKKAAHLAQLRADPEDSPRYEMCFARDFVKHFVIAVLDVEYVVRA